MPDHFYVYPAYLRKKGARAGGRRVALELAVAEVTTEEIASAARSLGYAVELEPAKPYPRQAHLGEGRVKIAKKAGTRKTQVLRELAQALRPRSSVGGPG